MTVVVLAASALLAAVAAAGILRPFSRGGTVAMERLADPLEDERQSLLRALRDLEEERATGQISEQDYAGLRGETEVRAVAVLRALEARDGSGDLARGLRELRAGRSNTNPNGAPDGSGRNRWLAGLVAAALSAAVVVPLLVGAVANRAPGQPATGSLGNLEPTSLAFFVQRVRQHPNDLAARLDLAQRYQLAGDVEQATQQYLEALRLDPENPEARAALGFLLYRAGHPAEALQQVDRALAADPGNPEALYDQGVILWKGLHRDSEAAIAFRAYLAAAPFGSHRDEVEADLRQLLTTP